MTEYLYHSLDITFHQNVPLYGTKSSGAQFYLWLSEGDLVHCSSYAHLWLHYWDKVFFSSLCNLHVYPSLPYSRHPMPESSSELGPKVFQPFWLLLDHFSLPFSYPQITMVFLIGLTILFPHTSQVTVFRLLSSLLRKIEYVSIPSSSGSAILDFVKN